MGIEKLWLLTRESVYWINMNGNIEHMVEQCTICLEYHQTQSQEKALHYEIPSRPWEVDGADIFMTKTFLYIVDYHSKFTILKKVNSLSPHDLVQMTKLTVTKYGLLKKIISDAGTNFITETFKDFCRKMNTQQTITSPYQHQSNGQVEACLKFVSLKNLDTNRYLCLALLQIQLMPIRAGIQSPATMLFNKPRRGLLPQMNRDPITVDNNNLHHEVLEANQEKW